MQSETEWRTEKVQTEEEWKIHSPFILLFPEMEEEREEDTNDVMKKFEHIQTERCVCSCTTALNCSHFLQTLGSNDDEKKRCAR